MYTTQYSLYESEREKVHGYERIFYITFRASPILFAVVSYIQRIIIG